MDLGKESLAFGWIKKENLLLSGFCKKKIARLRTFGFYCKGLYVIMLFKLLFDNTYTQTLINGFANLKAISFKA